MMLISKMRLKQIARKSRFSFTVQGLCTMWPVHSNGNDIPFSENQNGYRTALVIFSFTFSLITHSSNFLYTILFYACFQIAPFTSKQI